ncbi:uncharacterized protein [Lolium perenne]|uniref:uncharacterized protein n=1 Tax=Lolium perenne TaxID=4522 RepID=UPI0021F594AA|nr:uncharacterized protein LOC127347617 [Lolium perenne]
MVPMRKYHWVRWEALCKLKSLGVLGIIDTRLMNICLMTKWIWKLYVGEQGFWTDILRYKYLRSKDLLVDSHRPGSQFWNSIQKVKSMFSQGVKHQVRNGESTHFWDDWWQGQGPFKDRYPTLYDIAADPHVTVSGCCSTEGWHIDFPRGLGAHERVDLNTILAGVMGFHLSEGHDVISWVLEPSGKFSVWNPVVRRRDREALEQVIGRLRTLHASIRNGVD